MKSEEKRQRQEAAGIPDSKPFTAPDAPPSRIESCHINGVLVSDLHLDPQVLAALDYWASDEGIAEKNANPNARQPSGIELGDTRFEKALQEKRDDVLDRDYDSYHAADPFREVADKYAAPGMRPKFMSARNVRDGGNRDYEVVKDAGEPVKCKGMILGHIPESIAQSRNKHFQRKGNQFIESIKQKQVEIGNVVDGPSR